MKESFTIDDFGSKSNLQFIQTLITFEKSLFYKIIGFTQSLLGVLGDIDEIFQLIPGGYKSDKPVNFTGMDKTHLKYDCINGSIVNGIREPIFFSFPLDQPARHKIQKEPGIELFKNVNEPILPHISFYLEDNNHKSIDFNGETISFTCQLIKI